MGNFGSCAGVALVCGGCAVTRPISVIVDNGQILRGSFSAVPGSGVEFSVSDGVLTCSGGAGAGLTPDGKVVVVPVKCSDGRPGAIGVLRGQGTSGAGAFKLADGTHGLFVFGGAHMTCDAVGQQIGDTAQRACVADATRRQIEAQQAANRWAAIAAVTGALGDAASTFSAAYTAPVSLSYQAPPVYAPSASPTPVADPCAMMSCPQATPPAVQYVPVAPGDPLNAGLKSSGYPTR